MACLEVPNTNLDIDLGTADEGNLAYDGDVASGTNHQLLIEAGGNWAVGDIDHFTIVHGTKNSIAGTLADQYLYLLSGVATAATFTQGKYVITLEGYAVPDDK